MKTATRIRFRAVNAGVICFAEALRRAGIEVFSDDGELERTCGVRGGHLGVDFRNEVVCLLSRGVKPTGGYSLRVKDVRREDDKVIIHVVTKDPGPHDFVTTMMSTPMAMIALPKRELCGSVELCFLVKDDSGRRLASKRASVR